MLERTAAYVLVALTFVLLLIGGTVNPTGSSLACPEPTMICHGQFFPEMTGGVLFEHGHRLAAMTVGLLQIALTVLLWRRRRDLRKLAVLALVMVCAQGTLGALTVKYKLPWAVSTAHLILAMSYLATLLLIARKTRTAAPTAAERTAARRVLPWIGLAAGFVLCQILLGGLVRHTGAALASVDLPFDHGRIWPVGGPPLLKLHMAHRIGGVLVGLVVLFSAVQIARRAGAWRRMRLLALALPVVVLGQISLGAWVIASFRAVPVAVAHFGGATLLWTLLASMFWMAREARGRRFAEEPQRALDPVAGKAVAG